ELPPAARRRLLRGDGLVVEPDGVALDRVPLVRPGRHRLGRGCGPTRSAKTPQWTVRRRAARPRPLIEVASPSPSTSTDRSTVATCAMCAYRHGRGEDYPRVRAF